jgi:serine protease Do
MMEMPRPRNNIEDDIPRPSWSGGSGIPLPNANASAPADARRVGHAAYSDSGWVGYVGYAAKLPLVVFVSLAVAALAATSAFAQSSTVSDPPPDAVVAMERTLVDLIGRTEPSVVAVFRSAPRQAPPVVQGTSDAFAELRENASRNDAMSVVGAGVIIDRAGFVLTHYLAVREGEEHVVSTSNGQRYPAVIHGADPRSGLAMLKIASPEDQSPQPGEHDIAKRGRFPALRLGDASPARKGQFVVAIGNPYAIASDGQATASWGIVTNLARKAPSGANLNNAPGPYNDFRTTLHHLGTLIQTDARLGWSAGGGALVNLRGELIGLTTTTAAIAGHEQPAGYAIPINPLMRRVIETLQLGREVEYGMLGVGFGAAAVDSTAEQAARLSVAQVYPGGPAARAGLQAGDIITSVANRPVDDVDAVQLAVSSMPPSTTTTLEYNRGGRTATAEVTLAKLAVSGNAIATSRPDAWRGIRVDYATALDAAQLAQAIGSGAYDAAGCVQVREVEPNSVAWRAGVRAGMFISHVGDRRVATPEEFRAAVQNLGQEFDIRLTQPLEPAGGASN